MIRDVRGVGPNQFGMDFLVTMARLLGAVRALESKELYVILCKTNGARSQSWPKEGGLGVLRA